MDIKQFVPRPIRLRIRHHRARRHEEQRFSELLATHAGGRQIAVSVGAAAPPEIIETTALMNAKDLHYKSRPDVFTSSGYRAMGKFIEYAARSGFRLDQVDAAFELGCGGGRLIRHLRAVSGLRLVGSDLQGSAIEWCRANVPGVEFHTNELGPPLVFADDEAFDFAFAYSVFTHIPLTLQVPWMTELARIVKPGGFVAVTVLGPSMADKMMNDAECKQLVSAGCYEMDATHPRVSESSVVLGSWDTFMTREYAEELFAGVLDVVEYIDAPQAFLILKKQ